MNNITSERAIRKLANSIITGHRPTLGYQHSVTVESSLEALAELADELDLFELHHELTTRLTILRTGRRLPTVALPPSTTPLTDAIAERAAEALPSLLCELRESGADSNRIALGELHTGDEYLQIQLVVTANQGELLDDDHVMGSDE